MLNRLTGEEVPDENSLAKLQETEEFMKLPGARVVYAVFSNILGDAGWNKTPPELAIFIQFTCQTFLVRAWKEAYTEPPLDILKASDHAIGDIMIKLYRTITEGTLLDSFIECVFSKVPEAQRAWETEEKFRQTWSTSLVEAIKTKKTIDELAILVDRAYPEKNQIKMLVQRTEIFHLWKKVRASQNDPYGNFYYMGSTPTVAQGVQLALSSVAEIIQVHGNTNSRMYIYGELSDLGMDLMRAAVKKGREDTQVDESLLTYEKNGITIFSQELVNTVDRLTTMVNSAQVTFSLLALATSGLFTRIYAVTNSLLAAMVHIGNESEKTMSKMELGTDWVATGGKTIDAKHIDQVLLAYTWNNPKAGSESDILALLKAEKTEDGYVFSELKNQAKRIEFGSVDSITPIVWALVDKLTDGDKESLAQVARFDIEPASSGSPLGIGIPILQNMKIF